MEQTMRKGTLNVKLGKLRKFKRLVSWLMGQRAGHASPSTETDPKTQARRGEPTLVALPYMCHFGVLSLSLSKKR